MVYTLILYSYRRIVHDCVEIFNSFNLQFLDIIKMTKLTKNMAPMCDIPVDSLDRKVNL